MCRGVGGIGLPRTAIRLQVESSLVSRRFLLSGSGLKLNVLFMCSTNKRAPTEPVNVVI